MSVRTRFAPSPTGYLHIGGVRTALFNWLFARQHGGQFVLRIDDTDAERNVDEALKPILDGFLWLGMNWDEGPTPDGADSNGPYGPYFQSQRLEKHQAAAATLLEKGLAYRDYATPEELAAEKEAAKEEKRDFLYSRTWMAETEEEAKRFESEGRSYVVRLKMPREGQCVFHDLIKGESRFDWAREQDHVIQRADGSCLYHLASVVDDHEFAITHVIRGDEHFSNTPRQIFILQGLGYEMPTYAHIPAVAEPGSRNKLSKRKIEKYLKNRDFFKLHQQGVEVAERIGLEISPASFNPVLVAFYRDTGFLPEALLNYMVLVGWSLDDKTEDFSVDDMLKHFSLERVVKATASFDPLKLIAFQQKYMNQLPLDKKVEMCAPYLVQAELVSDPASLDLNRLRAIIEAAGDRICVAGDILKFDDFYCSTESLKVEDKAFQKRIVKPGNAVFLLQEFKKLLVVEDDFSAENLERLLKGFCESQEIKIGEIIHALRVATTGKAAGFGMFETLEILGRDEVTARIDHVSGLA